MKDPKFFAQLIAELLDAEEQAYALLAGAMGDVIGSGPLADALQARLAKAQAATPHPTRDRLVRTALKALQAQRGAGG